jgi:hypothetical protein
MTILSFLLLLLMTLIPASTQLNPSFSRRTALSTLLPAPLLIPLSILALEPMQVVADNELSLKVPSSFYVLKRKDKGDLPDKVGRRSKTLHE